MTATLQFLGAAGTVTGSMHSVAYVASGFPWSIFLLSPAFLEGNESGPMKRSITRNANGTAGRAT